MTLQQQPAEPFRTEPQWVKTDLVEGHSRSWQLEQPGLLARGSVCTSDIGPGVVDSFAQCSEDGPGHVRDLRFRQSPSIS